MAKILSNPRVHGPREPHRWVRIKRGYPQRICSCGEMMVPKFKSGENTIAFNNPILPDVVQWQVAGTAVSSGDLGMYLTSPGYGRPNLIVDSFLQDLVGYIEIIGDRKWLYTCYSPSGFFPLWGFTIASLNGGSVANAVANQGQFSLSSTGASANADAGFTQTVVGQGIHYDYLPYMTFVIRTGASLANARFWVGLFTANPMASDTIPANSLGFRFSTSAGDVTWMAITNDGVASEINSVGAAVAPNTTYILTIIGRNPPSIFVVKAGGVQSLVTNAVRIPGSGNNLIMNSQVRTLVNSSLDINISHLLCSMLPGTSI